MPSFVYLSNPNAENLQQEAFWHMLDNPHEHFVVAGFMKENTDVVQGVVFIKLDPMTTDQFHEYLNRRDLDFACAPQTFPNDEKIIALDQATFDKIWPQLSNATEEGMSPRDSIVKMLANEN